ncbi:hypothetical protein FW946_04925 [Campylobacter jejuni]|nr:hypothetical protein [Campylobacter jejuni]
MGTSLNELKTGREKLEIINQVLARINSISEAIDNTRLDEVVGLKQACESLKNECLKFKNDIVDKNDDILSKYDDINKKYSNISEKYNNVNAKFDYIKEAYEDFSLNKQEIQNIKDFLENNTEEFENLKKDIQKYEEIKFNLDNYINEIKQNKDFVKEYFDLNTKIKDEILSELNHALEIVDSLHLNVDELKEIKPELISIKKEVKDLANEAKLVVSEASEIIKNKINTIFFENQRLNQEMIDSVKKLEEIKFDIGVKYKEIASAYELLLESKQNIEDLREVIALYKEFENDITSYSQIIKDFKSKIENLERDLKSQSESIYSSLNDKQNEILKKLNEVKNEALVKFDELTAKCEGYKIHFEQSYDRFNQRALIANEDLGRLAEVAKKELGNDKLIYETELKVLAEETIKQMEEMLKGLSDERNEVTEVFETQTKEFTTLVDTSKVMIDNLNHIFNANYQAKKNEFSIIFNEKLHSLNENKQDFLNELVSAKENGLNKINETKEQSLNEIIQTKEQGLNELETKKGECIDEIDNQARIYDISGVKANVEYLLSLLNEKDDGKDDGIKDEIANIEQGIKDKEQELEEIKKQIEEALNNNDELKQKNEELKEIKNQIDEALSQEPPADTSELEERKEELENQIAELEKEIAGELINKKEEIEKELEEANQNLEDKNNELEQNEKDKKLITQKVLDITIKTLEALIDTKVSLNGDEEINGNKTFANPILVKVVPTNDNHLTNKIYVDTALKTKANLNGDNIFNGANTFNQALTSPTNPTNDNHLTRKWYVDYGGGIKNLGNQTAPKIDLRQAQHFILTMTAKGAIGIANWASAGKSGTITVNNAQNITAFSAPFKFRVAQSGFSGTETFAYFCIASNNVRLVRT